MTWAVEDFENIMANFKKELTYLKLENANLMATVNILKTTFGEMIVNQNDLKDTLNSALAKNDTND